ncbi:DNA-binding NarL/FixJ family response regulator [Bradyrhizobium sp. AZCC 1588]|uniref:response regulator transcription factor n=1 Tax=Bradyrhizobium sp. AZCC 1614 TaxID=3117017 RepID=UPI002FEF0FF1
MRIIIVTPVRLLGEGLATCLSGNEGASVHAVVNDFGALRRALTSAINVVLIDVSSGFDLEEVRCVAAEHPRLRLIAIGLRERSDEVIRCGRAGFAAYVPRDAPIETLCDTMAAAVVGRLTCPPEIACSLLRQLFNGAAPQAAANNNDLTRREGDVLRLLGRGFSNKEIARELGLSVGTVKHHVHSILSKLGVPRRTHAMRRVREAPWIA